VQRLTSASETEAPDGVDFFVEAIWSHIQHLRKRKGIRTARALAQIIIFGKRLQPGEQADPDPSVPFAIGTLEKAILRRLRRGSPPKISDSVGGEDPVEAPAPARPASSSLADAPASARSVFSSAKFRAKVLPTDTNPKKPIDLSQFNRGKNAALEEF